jgi:hypothetical protein
MSEQNQRAPVGSQNATLQQDAVTSALLVTAAPGVPVPVDVTDRWARLLGQVDLARVLGAALAAGNPVIAGIYDALGNRMPAMDAAARPGFVDPIDRAARLLGVVYGSQAAQLQQVAGTLELRTMEASPTAVVEGQVTLTGAAQQLPADACKSVTLENPSTNAVVCVGHDNAVTLANGYRLQPGATWSLAIDNVNRIWVIGTAAQVISYGGVN